MAPPILVRGSPCTHTDVSRRTRATFHVAGGVSTGNPDWVTIHGLLSLAVYGGRIDNAQDERLLGAYLQ